MKILITGASKGIGLQIAKELAECDEINPNDPPQESTTRILSKK